MLEVGIARAEGLSRWQIVVAVFREREVAGANRLAQNAEADAFRGTEKHLQSFFALCFGEFVPNEPCGRIGERSAEAINLLILYRVVHGDGEIRRARSAKS